jgi:hypothetical protein
LLGSAFHCCWNNDRDGRWKLNGIFECSWGYGKGCFSEVRKSSD